MKMRKGLLSLTFVVFLAGLLIAGWAPKGEAAPASDKKVVRLTTGSTSSSSSFFAMSVGVVRVINKYAPGVHVTLVESEAGLANFRRMREGILNMAMVASAYSLQQMYGGFGEAQGKPWKEIRALWLYGANSTRFIVKAKSGIKTFSDFKGKKLYTGGSLAVRQMPRRFDEILGVGAKLQDMSIEDAMNAFADGRIDGFTDSQDLHNLGKMMQIHFTDPIRIVGLTKEQAQKVQAKYPEYYFSELKKGTIKDFPEAGGMYERSYISGAAGSTRISEDVVYKMVKAVVEHWDEVAAAYPPSGAYHPLKDYFSMIPVYKCPFHEGVIRYCKEIGLAVPEIYRP